MQSRGFHNGNKPNRYVQEEIFSRTPIDSIVRLDSTEPSIAHDAIMDYIEQDIFKEQYTTGYLLESKMYKKFVEQKLQAFCEKLARDFKAHCEVFTGGSYTTNMNMQFTAICIKFNFSFSFGGMHYRSPAGDFSKRVVNIGSHEDSATLFDRETTVCFTNTLEDLIATFFMIFRDFFSNRVIYLKNITFSKQYYPFGYSKPEDMVETLL